MQEKKPIKKESQKSLGKLVNIMVLDYLREYKEGLSESELINKITKDYGLEEAAYLERLDRKPDSGKEGILTQRSSLKQTIRGQMRRALEALSNIEDYLDVEKDGTARTITFWKRFGVEVVDTRKTEVKQHGKFYKLHSLEGLYDHKLSDEELRTLMFLIRGNQSVNGTQSSSILRKLQQYGSYNFRQEIKSSFVGEDFLSEKDADWDKEFIVQDYVMDNVSLLQKVIQENYKKEKRSNENPELTVEFEFYAYDENLRLRPAEEILGKARWCRNVTPLKVFQDMGRFFVYVAAEKEKSWVFLTYRVDLMRNLVERNVKKSGGKVYIPSEEQKKELRFGNIKKYLNMSFSSEVEEIRFLFLRERITAIVDSFGRKDIKITRFKEEERELGKAIVKLKEGEKEIFIFDENKKERVLCRLHCTEFGFVNWAMQYSDFVQVLEPQSVVKKIKEKIQTLVTRYDM